MGSSQPGRIAGRACPCTSGCDADWGRGRDHCCPSSGVPSAPNSRGEQGEDRLGDNGGEDTAPRLSVRRGLRCRAGGWSTAVLLRCSAGPQGKACGEVVCRVKDLRTRGEAWPQRSEMEKIKLDVHGQSSRRCGYRICHSFGVGAYLLLSLNQDTRVTRSCALPTVTMSSVEGKTCLRQRPYGIDALSIPT